MGPLDGVKVVELGVWVAGPGAAGILADWGADVIKIESPAGDPARQFVHMLGGDLDINPVFELDNRGKRSVVLELGSPEGLEAALALLGSADVFVTNIRASALDRLGLGPDALLDRFDQLVYAIITGYGL
jgi:crotonobetainyl-CoA:carnitine CoA-transferase CaiB-like acyl-CoA transferase